MFTQSKKYNFIFSTIEELIPLNNKVRELEKAIDMEFIYSLVKPFERPSMALVVFFNQFYIL